MVENVNEGLRAFHVAARVSCLGSPLNEELGVAGAMTRTGWLERDKILMGGGMYDCLLRLSATLPFPAPPSMLLFER